MLLCWLIFITYINFAYGNNKLSFFEKHKVEKGLMSLQDLRPVSNCAKAALYPLLDDCGKTLQPEERSYYAVKLSQCEFEVAHVDYPRVCYSIDRNRASVMECANELETRPQWWTTYSGNYQLIGQICLEHAGDFEREKIIETYSRATKLQDLLSQSLEHMRKSLNQDMVYWRDEISHLGSSLSKDLYFRQKQTEKSFILFEEWIEKTRNTMTETSVTQQVDIFYEVMPIYIYNFLYSSPFVF